MSIIDNINVHLPRKTLSLRQVMMLKEPAVRLRDGNVQVFESEELEGLDKTPKETLRKIYLKFVGKLN